jgi:glycolate oxidase FAD binding subunit
MTATGSDQPRGSDDRTAELVTAVREAMAAGHKLQIVGSGTKAFYGRNPSGRPLSVDGHHGIVSYEPSELVVTARAGTRLAEIEAALAGEGQMLAFEPPRFGAGATLGGTVACNFSGPRRPYAGAARDFVLGTRLISGKGEVLRFGGEVMKNVAGYDVSRLMAGAMGTLGLLLDISLKVLPVSESEATRCFDVEPGEAIERMNELAGRPLPLSGAAWVDDRMYIRLSGSAAGVASAAAELGGDQMSAPEADLFWSDLREQRLPFFQGDGVLWRVSVPPATGPVPVEGRWMIDWGGGQRWLRTDSDPDPVRLVAGQVGGHATVFRGGDRAGEVFQPLGEALLGLHRRIKQAMDPQGVLNPGRMYAGI